MDVLSQAKYEDMTEEQKMLIDTIGADCFMDLVRVYGGSYVYIPKNDNIVRSIRNRNIRNDFNGHNFKELAANSRESPSSCSSVRSSRNEFIQDYPFPVLFVSLMILRWNSWTAIRGSWPK